MAKKEGKGNWEERKTKKKRERNNMNLFSSLRGLLDF